MTDFGDIYLNGNPYRIDLTSYRVKDLADFSPRASVAGNSIVQSELMLYQPMYFTDFRHGYGFIWNTDAMGYMRTEGNLDTRFPGTVMLATAEQDIAETNYSRKFGMTEFNGYLWSWGAAGLRRCDFSTKTWTSVYSAHAVNFALATEEYLFFCPDGERIRKINKSSVQSDAGVNANSSNYKWLCIHKGKIYAGKNGNAEIYYDSSADLSGLHGTPADDPEVIYTGGGGFPTLGAIVYAGNLYVFRTDGIWNIGDDGLARCVVDYTSERSDKNFMGYTIYNGYLYFTIAAKIYQWNGSRVTEVTPPRFNDSFPYADVLKVGQLTTANNFLYGVFDWRDPITLKHRASLFCFDGVGWHKLNDFQSSTSWLDSTNPGMIYYSPSNRVLVINYWFSFLDNLNYFTVYISQGTTMPYPTYTQGGYSFLYTSRLDAGFRRIKKSMPSILVEASNVSSARKILIQYSADGGAWTTWGSVIANGITELTYPGGNPTLEFNYIIFRIGLLTDDSAQTPILEGFTLRFLLRPDVFYGYNFNVFAGQNMNYGDVVDGRSPADIISQLKTARDSKAPIDFVDIFGTQTKVYITSLTVNAAERHNVSDDGIPNVESIVNINLAEAK